MSQSSILVAWPCAMTVLDQAFKMVASVLLLFGFGTFWLDETQEKKVGFSTGIALKVSFFFLCLLHFACSKQLKTGDRCHPHLPQAFSTCFSFIQSIPTYMKSSKKI